MICLHQQALPFHPLHTAAECLSQKDSAPILSFDARVNDQSSRTHPTARENEGNTIETLPCWFFVSKYHMPVMKSE